MPAAAEHHFGSGCSRPHSRAASAIIQSEILRLAAVEPRDLPEKCVLDPTKDLFGHQESHVLVGVRSTHKCGFCGKTFKSSFYMVGEPHLPYFSAPLTTTLPPPPWLPPWLHPLLLPPSHLPPILARIDTWT